MAINVYEDKIVLTDENSGFMWELTKEELGETIGIYEFKEQLDKMKPEMNMISDKIAKYGDEIDTVTTYLDEFYKLNKPSARKYFKGLELPGAVGIFEIGFTLGNSISQDIKNDESWLQAGISQTTSKVISFIIMTSFLECGGAASGPLGILAATQYANKVGDQYNKGLDMLFKEDGRKKIVENFETILDMASGNIYKSEFKIEDKLIIQEIDPKNNKVTYKGDIPTISKLWNNGGSEYIDGFEVDYNMPLELGEEQPKLVYDGKYVNIFVNDSNVLNYYVEELKEKFSDLYNETDDIRVYAESSKAYKVEKKSLQEIATESGLENVLKGFENEELIQKIVEATKLERNLDFKDRIASDGSFILTKCKNLISGEWELRKDLLFPFTGNENDNIIYGGPFMVA